MKYLLVTDIPAPWREMVFEQVHQELGDAFHVVYCGRNEKRRLWNFPHGNHSRQFLRPITYFVGGGDRFFNPGIIPLMLQHRPKIVIIFGFKDPTMLLAYLLAKGMGTKVIVFADTWLGRDKRIGMPQRMLRQCLFRHFGNVYLGASQKTLEMFQHYNPRIPAKALFQSALCADNDFFRTRLEQTKIERTYDLMFSGRIVDGKNPIFLAKVAAGVKRKLGRCRILIIGEGNPTLKQQMFHLLQEAGVDFKFAGFIPHRELPDYYAQAKLLLLPTSEDCWGVVINEAMISGTPVITTNMTAAAFELVDHRKNGLILPMEEPTWVKEITTLLESPETLKTFSTQSIQNVSRYTFRNAARGMISAIEYADQQLN